MNEQTTGSELYDRLVAAPKREAIARQVFNQYLAARTKPRTGLTALLRATTSRRAWA